MYTFVIWLAKVTNMHGKQLASTVLCILSRIVDILAQNK